MAAASEGAPQIVAMRSSELMRGVARMFARAMQSRKCPSRGALALVRRFEISLLNYLEDCSVFEAIQVDDFWACVVFLRSVAKLR